MKLVKSRAREDKYPETKYRRVDDDAEDGDGYRDELNDVQVYVEIKLSDHRSRAGQYPGS